MTPPERADQLILSWVADKKLVVSEETAVALGGDIVQVITEAETAMKERCAEEVELHIGVKNIRLKTVATAIRRLK